MEPRKALALSGALVLILGVFMPIVSMPLVGTLTYFKNGQGDGVIILALGAISLGLIFLNRIRLLLVTGIISLGILGFTFYQVESRLHEATGEMERDLAGNPFAGFARGVLEGVQLQWGWALLVAGAILVIVASRMKASTRRKCPHCAEQVRREAKVCKHCGRDVSPEPESAAEQGHDRTDDKSMVVIGGSIAAIVLGAFGVNVAMQARAANEAAKATLVVTIKREGDVLRFISESDFVWKQCRVRIGTAAATLAELQPGSSTVLAASAFSEPIPAVASATVHCTDPENRDARRVYWSP